MRKKKTPSGLGFKVAFRGIGYAFWSQRNMRIHGVVACVVIALGLWVKLPPIEWMICFGTITMVFVAEMVNTSIEILVDLVTKKQKYRAMLSKDVAAGAVLLASIGAAIVGYLLFFQRVCTLLGWRN